MRARESRPTLGANFDEIEGIHVMVRCGRAREAKTLRSEEAGLGHPVVVCCSAYFAMSARQHLSLHLLLMLLLLPPVSPVAASNAW